MNELLNKLWTPGEDEIIKSHLQNFTNHIQSKYQLHFPSYDELWKWSVDEKQIYSGRKYWNILKRNILVIILKCATNLQCLIRNGLNVFLLIMQSTFLERRQVNFLQ